MLRKSLSMSLAATVLALGVAATAPAEAQYYRHGYYGHRYGIGPGAIVGGALLGLGVGALLAAPYYRPPVVYAPPPAYYAPPAYAYAPPAYYPYYRPY